MENGLLTKLHQRYCENDDYLDALRMLQYDMLYGDMLAYGGAGIYTPVDMQMGFREIQIHHATYVEGRYYIVGENFTKSSQVYINDHGADTTFISDTVLLLSDDALQEGDQITVRQITGDFIELGSTKAYIYTKSQEPHAATIDEAED